MAFGPRGFVNSDAIAKARSPAPGKAPPHPPGESVRIALTLDADGRERTFRALRPLLPTDRWVRVTIGNGLVAVEGLRPGDVEPVARVLDRLADESARRAVRREVA
jgi:hypothetical protein